MSPSKVPSVEAKARDPIYGQIVLGPPGSGKTTYVNGMSQMLSELKRPCLKVNLDPANDNLPFDVDIDVRDLVSVEQVMEEFTLGPNGALVWAMEFLGENMDWLEDRLLAPEHAGKYVLLDCPGQVELYTHYSFMRDLVTMLEKRCQYRLVAVHLVDSTLCVSPTSYISSLLVSLSCMTHLELPHLNLMAKMDLLKEEELEFPLDSFLNPLSGEGFGLPQLIDQYFKKRAIAAEEGGEGEGGMLLHPMERQAKKFAEALNDIMDDYSLVGFLPLDVQDKESTLNVLSACDKANGHCFIGDPTSLFDAAMAHSQSSLFEQRDMLAERYSKECLSAEAVKGRSSIPVGCFLCGFENACKVCSRCKGARYCGVECQKKDWKNHKSQCQ